MKLIKYIIKELIVYIKNFHIHKWECIDIFDSSNCTIPEGRSLMVYVCPKCEEYRYTNVGVFDWLDKEMFKITKKEYLELKKASERYVSAVKREDIIRKIKEESKRIIYKRTIKGRG